MMMQAAWAGLARVLSPHAPVGGGSGGVVVYSTLSLCG